MAAEEASAGTAAATAAMTGREETHDEGKTYLSIQEHELDLTLCVDKVASPLAGATSTFLGTTRNNFKGKVVQRLEYEGYVPMALKELQKITVEARSKWPDLLGIAIQHRIGVVPVLESSVVIAVSSAHRRDGLEAVGFLIDELKARVPIWKLEVYEGDARVWKENCECTHGPRMMVPAETA